MVKEEKIEEEFGFYALALNWGVMILILMFFIGVPVYEVNN